MGGSGAVSPIRLAARGTVGGVGVEVDEDDQVDDGGQPQGQEDPEVSGDTAEEAGKPS